MKIKKLLAIVLLLLLTVPVMSQDLVSSFLESVPRSSKKNITQVNVSGKMLRYAANNDSDIDKEIKKLFESIDKISMVTGLAVNDDLTKQLETCLKPYEELLSVIEEGQTIRMYTKERKKQIEEFVLYVSSESGITLMSITGKIDIKQISRLSENLSIKGIEHLDKVNKE